MRYKNIKLLSGKDSSAELLVHVWLPDNADDDLLEYAENGLCIDLQYYICCKGWSVNVTKPTEHLIVVQMNSGLGFTCEEVSFLVNNLYKEVKTFVESNTKGVTVKIGVHVDGPGKAFVFFDENGNWYNEDSVTPEEFLANVEF